MCLKKENKLYIFHRGFVDTSYDEISGIGNPEMLLNIMSCCIYFPRRYSNSYFDVQEKFIFMLPIQRFLMLSHNSQALKNIPDRVKQRIHEFNMHENYCVMTFRVEIPSDVDTLNKIHISKTICSESKLTYYDDEYYGF